MKDIGQVVKAVTSAMVGVGKKEDLIKNLERTEEQGPRPYIVVGLIMTVGFIAMIIVIVKLVLP
ncbi:DUF2970 domain-containing protein [Candidatus Thioglobus sp.]|uniref:DUF2970 domain-containing protein n=1 Tax=Candidatus Thioglobus sp. TaxID=2026721 RepID=UPI00260EF36F|nr:DUF2970 domain-containing protein [Candidatus Thioglobus sp.]MDG2394963.1 DUF2970 domain-containing protein [Candidatus Thioglobus sp.]